MAMMHEPFRSTGDPRADRRYAYALDYAAGGDLAAACDMVREALDLAPDFPPAHDRLAVWSEALGEGAAAEAALRTLLRLDPQDIFGASLRLARLGVMPQPDAPPEAYVRGLFDAYAARFDSALVETLGYRTPERLAQMIAACEGAPDMARVLDLGCGTGLMGEALRARALHLDGIDLSPDMVAHASAKKIYDTLSVASLGDALRDRAGARIDIIVAADVFCYLGALDEVFAAAAAALRPGGLLAFSVEAHEGQDPWVLRGSLRYAHARAPLTAALEAAGFTVAAISTETIRNDRGAPIIGDLVIALKQGGAADETLGAAPENPQRPRTPSQEEGGLA